MASKILKIAAVLLIIAFGAYLLNRVGVSELKGFVGGYGIYAPIVYIACFAILPIFLFPVPILAVVAGAMFGLVWGSVYTIVGAMINSILMFYIARFLGFKSVSNFIGRSDNFLAKLDKSVNKFVLILILRLIPLVPYNALNYACGLINVSLKDYAGATFVGIVPATFIMVNLGDKVLDVKSFEFAFACVLMVLLVVLSSWGAKKLRAKNGDLGRDPDL